MRILCTSDLFSCPLFHNQQLHLGRDSLASTVTLLLPQCPPSLSTITLQQTEATFLHRGLESLRIQSPDNASSLPRSGHYSRFLDPRFYSNSLKMTWCFFCFLHCSPFNADLRLILDPLHPSSPSPRPPPLISFGPYYTPLPRWYVPAVHPQLSVSASCSCLTTTPSLPPNSSSGDLNYHPCYSHSSVSHADPPLIPLLAVKRLQRTLLSPSCCLSASLSIHHQHWSFVS